MFNVFLNPFDCIVEQISLSQSNAVFVVVLLFKLIDVYLTTIECIGLYYDDYVWKNNFLMEVDANSLRVERLTRSVMGYNGQWSMVNGQWSMVNGHSHFIEKVQLVF